MRDNTANCAVKKDNFLMNCIFVIISFKIFAFYTFRARRAPKDFHVTNGPIPDYPKLLSNDHSSNTKMMSDTATKN